MLVFGPCSEGNRQLIKSGNNVRKILFCHFRVTGKAVEHLFPCQPLQRHFPAGRTRGQQLRTEAFHQSGQQRQSFRQSALTVAVQSPSDVVSGDAHVFGLRQQQGFGKLADKAGICAGKFVHFVAYTQGNRRGSQGLPRPACLPSPAAAMSATAPPVFAPHPVHPGRQNSYGSAFATVHSSASSPYSSASFILLPVRNTCPGRREVFSSSSASGLYPVQPAAGNSAAGHPALSTPP